MQTTLSLEESLATRDRERRGEKKRKRERTDAGSESRNKVYFDYAEQQGGKDHKVGLRRKQYCPQMTQIGRDYHRFNCLTQNPQNSQKNSSTRRQMIAI